MTSTSTIRLSICKRNKGSIVILIRMTIFAVNNNIHEQIKHNNKMSYLIKPAGYKALLNLPQTEMGIKKIKDFFQQNLSSELRFDE